MRTLDTAAWLQQQSELKTDESGNGERFLKVLEFLATTAERRIDQGEEPLAALHVAIEENDRAFEALPSVILGQMLVVLATFWEFSEPMCRDLTVIERKIMIEQLAIKLQELQKEAQGEPSVEEHTSPA